MRAPTALTAGMLLFLATPVFAQTTSPMTDQAAGARPGNVIGTGNSLPMSSVASNTGVSAIHSPIAPRLPDPGATDASTIEFLKLAHSAVAARRTGAAQEALERAETRTLNRSVVASNSGTPDQNPVVQQISEARRAVGAGNLARAASLIDAVLANAITTPPLAATMGEPMTPAYPMPASASMSNDSMMSPASAPTVMPMQQMPTDGSTLQSSGPTTLQPGGDGR